MKTFRISSVIILLVIIILPLIGTTILVEDPEIVIKRSPLIIEVVVKDIRFNRISNLSFGEGWITLSVISKVVGNCPSEIVIRRFAVTSDLRFLNTEWDPSYFVGEHFIICLWPTSNGYSTMGLYNGKFVIEKDYIKNTMIGVDDFKRQIKEIRSGQKSKFPDELPRQTANTVKSELKKIHNVNRIMSAGSHMGGEFITFDFTWNPSYLPVQMHYNPGGAPAGTPDVNTIASLATTAYNLWADPYSFLTFQNASPFQTSERHLNDTFSLIYWDDPANIYLFAETLLYPNHPQDGVYYGPNSNTGVDILFNTTIIGTWYFSQTPPSSRTLDQIDFIEVLAHELGHAIGLQHNNNNSNSMMYPAYNYKTCPLRGQTDGDLAGVVYQHTMSPMSLSSGNISHSIVLSALSNRVINLSGTVTVPSGKIFQLDPVGVTLNFSSGSSLQIYGTLTATGSAGSPIIFTGSGWNGISLYSSSSSLNYCKIRYASCGIYVESASPSIQNTWINYCGTGMSVYGGGPTLTTNTIYDNSGWGLNAYVNANVFMGYSKNNIIGYCSSGGIQAYADATVYASYGYNSIYLDQYSGSYRAAASGGGNVQASYSYWGSCPTTPSWFYQGLGGTINHSDSLCTDPNSGRSLYKQVSLPFAVNTGMIQKSRQNITSLNAELDQAYKFWQSKQYSATIDKCKSIIEKNTSTSNTVFPAISLLRLAAQEMEQSDIESYLQKTASTYDKQEFGGVALSNYIQYLMFKNRYKEALDNIDIAVNKYKNSNTEKTALFQKILVLYNHLNDTKKADVELTNFENKYPDDELTKELKRLTNTQDKPGFKIKPSPQAGNINNISDEISLSNFPNPFNPSTTIKYNVLKDGFITLKIYDMLGREVKTLVNEYKQAGNYESVWDASKSASGIYYYELKADGKSITKRMTLMK